MSVKDLVRCWWHEHFHVALFVPPFWLLSIVKAPSFLHISNCHYVSFLVTFFPSVLLYLSWRMHCHPFHILMAQFKNRVSPPLWSLHWAIDISSIFVECLYIIIIHFSPFLLAFQIFSLLLLPLCHIHSLSQYLFLFWLPYPVNFTIHQISSPICELYEA